MPSKIGLVVALASEAKTLVGPGPLQPMDGYGIRTITVNPTLDLIVGSAGVGGDAARKAAQGVIDHGASALLSAGLSGGLDPGISPGDIILPSRLLLTDGRRIFGAWEPDPAVVEGAYYCFATEGMPVRRGTVLTVDDGVLTPDAKAALFAQFRGLAVDMESAAVARVAFEAGLPFFGLRVVCDPAERNVPKELYGFVDTKGNIRPGTIAKSLIRRPALVFDMWAMGRLFSFARNALRKAWEVAINAKLLEQIDASTACSITVSMDVGPNP